MKGFYQDIDLGDGRVLTLETGRLAKQASGSVVARLGDTMVLCTAVVADQPREGMNFFPLTVEYREKYSAGGRIPGGFFKREARPSEIEILAARLTDRSIRPLFPDGFRHETQIILNVISADEENNADVVGAVGASAALVLGGAPFAGPIGQVRVARGEDGFIINPTKSQCAESDMDIIVAGTEEALVMVEGEMDEVSEADMIAAMQFAHDAIRAICKAQHDLVAQVGGVEPMVFETSTMPDGVIEKVAPLAKDKMEAHLRQPYEKQTFYGGIADLKEEVLSALLGDDDAEAGTERAEATEEGFTAADLKMAVGEIERMAIREMVLNDGRRIDGRGTTDVRDLWMEVGYLPRAHGSAVFTRGETQALGSVTLGTSRDVQAVDQLFDQEDKTFYLHYNFPPFCTGEAKPIRSTSRREIGHGNLAERALRPMIPSQEEFSYTIRILSDVLESNGSSSMASVCVGTLALLDAGVPLKKPVAGIAMGLIKEGDQVAVLTDILGTEDHLGDMDFKVTGTRDGITACQMDIKVDGLTTELLDQALAQAHAARHHILDHMIEVMPEPRDDLSPYAPRLTQLHIDAEHIGAVIGPGGKVIRGIQSETNTEITIEEADGKGFVTIAAVSQVDADAAVEKIRLIVAEPEVGADYEGTVRSIQTFGAFIEILPGKEGLLHISEIDYKRVEKVEDYLQVGDKVTVRLLELQDGGKMRLSLKPFLEKPADWDEQERRRRESRQNGHRRDGRGGGPRGDRDRRGGGRPPRDRRRDR